MEIKITVGVITYNRPESLKQAVDSVLCQSYFRMDYRHYDRELVVDPTGGEQ